MNIYSENRLAKKKTTNRIYKENVKNSIAQRFLSYPYSNIFSFLLIALIAFLSYSNSFKCPFHFDDEVSIVNNNLITSLKYFWNLNFWLSSNRALANFSFALNYYFNRLDVFGYHLVNLVIHIIAGFFVFLLVKLILDLNNYRHYKLDKYKNWFALSAALIFVVHPIQTQAITYIVQRMASMAAMFYIISIYLYAIGRIEQEQKNNIFKAIILYIMAVTFGIFGVMTKQNAVTFPFAFLLFEFNFIRNKENKIFKNYIIISLSALIIACISFLLLNKEILAFALHGLKISSTEYLITQFVVIVKYLQLAILPINQCADYGNISCAFPYIKSFWRFDVVGCFLLLTGLFTLAVYLYKKNRAISFAILWFFLTLSIESSIIPIADPMFEHRMYLPMLGVCICFIYCVFIMLKKLNAVYLFFFIALIIFILAVMCHSRNEIWTNELTLWTDVVEKAPNNARAWYNIGVIFKKLDRNEEAIKYFNKALGISPDYDALFNKGETMALLGKYEEAIKCYNNVIEIKPDDYQTWNNKGNVLEKLGKYEEAIRSYNKAIEINPGFDLAWYNKGTALSAIGKNEEAILSYNKATEINPGLDLAWYSKGTALSTLGKNEESILCYNKAINIRRENYEAWYNKGTINAIIGKYEEAIKCYDTVIEIKPDFYQALNNKGNVLEKLGNYEEAIKYYDKALQIQPNFDIARNNKFIAQQKNKIRQVSVLKRSQ